MKTRVNIRFGFRPSESMHPGAAGPALGRIPDVFVFQCYTGLAYADLAGLNGTWPHAPSITEAAVCCG